MFILFGLLSLAAHGHAPRIDCAIDLSPSLSVTPELHAFAGRLAADGLGADHRLLVDGTSLNRGTLVTERYATSSDIPFAIERHRHAAGEPGYDPHPALRLRPAREAHLSVEMTVRPSAGPFTHRTWSPAEFAKDQVARARAARWRVTTLLDGDPSFIDRAPRIELATGIFFALPEEARAYRRAAPELNHLRIGASAAVRLPHRLGHGEALAFVRRSFKTHRIRLSPIEIRTVEGLDHLYVNVRANLDVPEDLDAVRVNAMFYARLYQVLGTRYPGALGERMPRRRSVSRVLDKAVSRFMGVRAARPRTAPAVTRTLDVDTPIGPLTLEGYSG